MNVMTRTILTLLSTSIVTLGLGLGGCDRHDASAAETSGGTPNGGVGAKTELLPAPTQKASDGSWKAEVKATGPYKAGVAATYDVFLDADPDGGYHVNLEYPYKFTAAVENGEPAQIEFKRGDDAFKLENCDSKAKEDAKICTRLHLTVKFTPKAGDGKIGGKLGFGVCNKDKCKMDSAPLALPIKVG